MPVLEAMATGLPVVTTDCLGVRTFCRHGENCLIGLPDDVAGVSCWWHVSTASAWQDCRLAGGLCAMVQQHFLCCARCLLLDPCLHTLTAYCTTHIQLAKSACAGCVKLAQRVLLDTLQVVRMDTHQLVNTQS